MHFAKIFLHCLLTLSCLLTLEAALTCQNGATYDFLNDYCQCSAAFHGAECQHSFASQNPCSTPSLVTDLSDTTAAHSLLNKTACSSGGTCIAFRSISTGWFRFTSPAGNYLVESGCVSSLPSCGSNRPLIIRDKFPESGATVQLYTAAAFFADSRYGACYDSSSSKYNVRILTCTSGTSLYFLVPTTRSTEHYCIGNEITTTASTSATTTTTTTTPTSTTTSTTTTTTTTPTPTTTSTTTTTATTPPSTTTSTTTTTTTSSSTTTQAPSDTRVHYLLSDGASFDVTVQLQSPATASDGLRCNIRSNSGLLRSNMPALTSLTATLQSGGTEALCNVQSLVNWLVNTEFIYVHAAVTVTNSSGHELGFKEVLVCRPTHQNSKVTYYADTRECLKEGISRESTMQSLSGWLGKGSPPASVPAAGSCLLLAFSLVVTLAAVDIFRQ